MIGITGSSGVLGRLLSQHLDSLGMAWSGFDGDIQEASAVERWIKHCAPDQIIHLAAKVPVVEVRGDPATALNVNVGGTLNLLVSASRAAKRPWIFMASTSHVYAPSAEPISEQSALSPCNNYGESKLLAESICNYFARYASLELCVGRIFSYFHDSQRPPFLYPTIKSRLKNHDTAEPFNIINGEDIRDFLSGEEVVLRIDRLRAVRALGVVNIASGAGTRILDFVKKIAGENVRIRSVQQNPPTSLIADISKYNEITRG